MNGRINTKNNNTDENCSKPTDYKSDTFLYEQAVAQLNQLQSNAQTIAKVQQHRRQMPETNVQETRECLNKLGISLDDIDRLNVVHITGTKGKGSTAAFLEAILRSYGYKTGFYCSPHLVHVRERIRIQGRPISEECFSKHFFHVYDTLDVSRKPDQQMPAYFKFLTILAFHIFCSERVDVAIVEVGIGGEYDCTNVIQNPIVCAITTLDLDHTKLLGNTLTEIAWHKAGIAKPGSILLSVQQPMEEAMEVIRQRCTERQCKFFTVPSALTNYEWPDVDSSAIKLGIAGVQQHMNASLALQLARIWMLQNDRKTKQNGDKSGYLPPHDFEHNAYINGIDPNDKADEQLPGYFISEKTAKALAVCRWPGRCQLIRRDNMVYHLDGAHTPQSIEFCAQWFVGCSLRNSNKINQDNIFRVLIFHCTSDRDPAMLLPKLKACCFDLSLFCPTRLDCSPPILTRENINLNMNSQLDLERCERDRHVWDQLSSNMESHKDTTASTSSSSLVLPSIFDTLGYVKKLKKYEVHILVTGSLHLVGGVLTLLDPECAT